MAAPIPLEAFYDLRLLTEVAVSPDGRRVAFIADEFDAEDDERRSGLYVAPADGSGEPHRLTHASSASTPRWSPDGARLGFLASRETDLAQKRARREDDGDDEDDPKTQVWLLDLERGGDARQLTDFDEGCASSTGAPTAIDSSSRLAIRPRSRPRTSNDAGGGRPDRGAPPPAQAGRAGLARRRDDRPVRRRRARCRRGSRRRLG